MTSRTPLSNHGHRNGMAVAYHCPPTGGWTGVCPYRVQIAAETAQLHVPCGTGRGGRICSGDRAPRDCDCLGDALRPPSQDEGSGWSSRGSRDCLSSECWPSRPCGVERKDSLPQASALSGDLGSVLELPEPWSFSGRCSKDLGVCPPPPGPGPAVGSFRFHSHCPSPSAAGPVTWLPCAGLPGRE